VDGISRMKDITGSFVIREQGGGHSILECYFLSEKASVIPRWITEPIITGSILNLMEAIRDELTNV
jgi:ribosomal protein S28E/S33